MVPYPARRPKSEIPALSSSQALPRKSGMNSPATQSANQELLRDRTLRLGYSPELNGLRWAVALLASSIALSAWGQQTHLTMIGSTVVRAHDGLDARADAVMVGCVLGIIVSSNLVRQQVQGWMSHVLCVAGLLSMSILARIATVAYWSAPVTYYWLLFVSEVLTAIIILDCFINPNRVVKRILSLKALVWIGSISYGLYLWHYPVYALLRDTGYTRNRVIILGTLITFAAATLSYYLLEQPFLGLKKKLEIRARP